ncbi:hypothetical protein [Streptomyces sp. NPDC058579]|uniref:hypothetical protein n=1 Tax=Streptomyces sp. NPDC058579 TaxID=3346548 RepID=UPI00364F0759
MRTTQAQKMLRLMESGEPVKLTVSTAGSFKKLTRLAFVAEQFGYAYEDLAQVGRAGFQISLVPDPSPQAQALAAANRTRYPHARDGGSLPPLVPEAHRLLKARMTLDLNRRLSDRQRLLLVTIPVTMIALALGIRFGQDTTGFITITAITLGSATALFAPLLVISRRHVVTYSAQLKAAGFVPTTDRNGRTRYVPPGGRLPEHGNSA